MRAAARKPVPRSDSGASMEKKQERGTDIPRHKIPGSQGRGNPYRRAFPDPISSPQVQFKTGCFVLHRIGPGREYEKLYGPYMDYEKACRKLIEYVEHFVREHDAYAPAPVYLKEEYAKVYLDGFIKPHVRDTFYFAVKQVGY